jgi:hypothetical protein
MPRTLSRSMRWGSILISLGAVFWLVQGALLISALPAVSSGFNLSPSSSSNNTTGAGSLPGHAHVWIAEYAVSGAVGTFVLATLFAALASVLLVVGILLILRGPGRGTLRDGALGGGSTNAFSRGTKALGVAAGAFIGVFATFGIVAFTILGSQGAGSIAANCGAWADGCPVTSALELWIAGSALLLVGAEIFGVFSERLSQETLGHIRIHGALFSNYAIVNLVGIAVVPFAVVMSPTNGGLSDSLLYAALFAQLFVVPLTGFVAWSWLSIQGFQSAFRQAGEPAGPEGESLASWRRSPEASEGRWAATPGDRRPSYAAPEGVGPAAGSGMISPLDPDWALRIQARMQNLERLVIAQNETISDLRSILTRLPADPGPTDGTVTTRIGRPGSLGQEPETITMPSLRLPPSSDLVQGSRLPETSPGKRPREVGGSPDQTNHGS